MPGVLSGEEVSGDPFGALGLPARPDLTDDDVRVAWRRIAAATHPDRDDGGEPARFAVAAAAYATLRTTYGRGEALADMLQAPATFRTRRLRRRLVVRALARARALPPLRALARARALPPLRALARARALRPIRYFGYRVMGGRWLMLGARLLAASAVCAVTFVAGAWSPGTVGVLTGALTWLVVTGRHDLIPAGARRGRAPGSGVFSGE